MRKRSLLISLLTLTCLLTFWEAAVALFDIPRYLIETPSAIVSYVGHNIGSISRHLLVTAMEAGLGFLLGSAAGFGAAVLFAEWRIVEAAFYPYVVALKAVPIVALAPLLVIWFGSGLTGKIIMSALICFFPVVVNVVVGLRTPGNEYIELFRSLNSSRLQTLLRLRVPMSLPYLFSALRMAATLSVVGAIVAEFSGAREGLGYLIMVSLYQLEIRALYAGIVVAGLCGYFFFWVVAATEARIMPWATHPNTP